jgi:hypothetical protein
VHALFTLINTYVHSWEGRCIMKVSKSSLGTIEGVLLGIGAYLQGLDYLHTGMIGGITREVLMRFMVEVSPLKLKGMLGLMVLVFSNLIRRAT